MLSAAAGSFNFRRREHAFFNQRGPDLDEFWGVQSENHDGDTADRRAPDESSALPAEMAAPRLTVATSATGIKK